MLLRFSLKLMRESAFEYLNDQGRGTKWSVAMEAVWRCGAAGSGAPRKGDFWLPGAAEETGAVGGQTASGAWAGTAHYSGVPGR